MTRSLLALALFGLLSTPALAGKRLPKPDVVEDAAAFATTDREKAARLLEDAATNGEVSANERPAVLLHAGEQRRLLGDTDASHKHFRAAEGEGSGAVRNAARLGLALLDAVDGLDSRVAGLLTEASDKEVLPSQNADRYLLLATFAASQNDARKQREYSRKALIWSREDDDVSKRVQDALAQLDAEQHQDTETPVDGETPADAEGQTTLDRAEAAWIAGDEAKARRLGEQAASSTDAAEAQAAKYFLRAVDAGAVRGDTIGVLLPLSGKYEVAGKQVKEAFELGYGSQRRKLVFVDSGATAESAVQALEKLVFDDRVVAVVGPLLTDTSEPVRQAAEAMRVPLVSLSQALEVAEGGKYLVQGQVTPQAQVRALLDHVVGVQELKSFAIFAPDNNYGRAASEAFKAEAEARGGKVTIVEYYDPAATDLIPFASKLGRKDYEARAREFRELKEATEEKGGNPDRVVLPPELDFEALFLPDNHKRVPIACAALAYEEFPIGEFQVEKDGPTIPLLGLSGWNHPDLVTRGGLYTRGSFFVDAFWNAEPDADPFVQEYRAETGRSPSALEASAYDVGQLVAGAAKATADNRPAFLSALHEAQVDGGVSGLSGVDDSGAAERSFHILTMNKDAIVEVPEPKTEGGE
ncbi:MAG: hypothetical protein EP330_06165 [Deltaproteobacteria bacterium]|nr:MAG: hypothetical protein EP330_06165 [Deltaproteobacteria bacterium]